MNTLSYKSSAGLLVLAAALMMPLAFAQSSNPGNTAMQSASAPPPAAASIAPTPTPTQTPPDATTTVQGTQSTQGTDTATAQASQASETASPNPGAAAPVAKKSGSGGQKTWAELDTDKDGNLSKAEAAADPSMKQVFAKADANGDGILTPDEYRAYYAKYQASATHK